MLTRRPRLAGTALVTGASAGIGAALAQALATRGLDLILCARRLERLETLAAMLRQEYGVSVLVVQADLSEPEAPERLVAAIRAAGWQVDVLANNAGFGVPGLLADNAWSRHRATLETMVSAPVRLCHLLAPDMAARGRGWILNTSSLAAFLPPHAGGTLYYPVKSFLLQFSLALRAELQGRGVSVTALCPGFTETEFQAAAGGTVESVSMPRWLWMSADTVAAAGLEALERGRPVCIPGPVNRLIALVFKLLPAALGRLMVRG